MAMTVIKQSTTTPNFLDSEVGLVLKTVQVDDTGITADEYGYKTIVGGTIYPANDDTATGIIFEDVDVTTGTDNGTRPASLITGGRILANRLPETIAAAAKTALAALGIVFVDMPETTRDDTTDDSTDTNGDTE